MKLSVIDPALSPDVEALKNKLEKVEQVNKELNDVIQDHEEEQEMMTQKSEQMTEQVQNLIKTNVDLELKAIEFEQRLADKGDMMQDYEN